MRCKVCGKEHNTSSLWCSVWCQGVAWREAEADPRSKEEILPIVPPAKRDLGVSVERIIVEFRDGRRVEYLGAVSGVAEEFEVCEVMDGPVRAGGGEVRLSMRFSRRSDCVGDGADRAS